MTKRETEMIRELREHDHKAGQCSLVNEWEWDFLTGLMPRRTLTKKQHDKLLQIWGAIFK